ncbi:PHP domain-containing protein [Desulfitobacterium hafniense]|uniref:PHP domain-containing protein n=1 Tax=Desulfitobacterium hafniense TaxID=49338 RepID=UPI000379B033|nr:PHP domain-containing protein [Desulfitobacterium hafniense]
MPEVKLRYPEADLHCHTSASDGLLTPWELVKQAAECGLKAVGITDHDTLSGWEKAGQAGKHFNVDILRGVELNTEWAGVEVHILGYEMNPQATILEDKLSELREARFKRVYTIIEKLQDLGIPIQKAEVERITKGESVGRPHIAQVLVNKGIVISIAEAFDRYIGTGGPAYVPRLKITPEEGIVLIRKAGGVAVLAHPGIYKLEKGIEQWVKAGLQGVEVSHSEHALEDEKKYRAIAKEYGLLMTGGSDFHGEERKPGVRLGGWGTSYGVVEEIRNLANLAYSHHI